MMQPLSGNSRDSQDVGEAVRAHVHQLQITYGMTYLVADGPSTVKPTSRSSPRHT
jgi:hypothetical protein